MITNHIRKNLTKLTLTFKACPRHMCFSFLCIHYERPHCQQESKVCFPYSADAQSYRPHVDPIYKLVKGRGPWWGIQRARRAHLQGFVVKKALGE